MQWIQEFQLFLFDFDGLLVNTEHIHYQAYIDLCRKMGFDLDWSFNEYCSYAHYSDSAIKEGIYAKFPKLFEKEPNWKVLYELKKEIYMQLLISAKIELMPGVKKLLLSLEKENIKRCVVTNSLKSHIDLIKTRSDVLKTIPHWITREDYDKPKPSPESYLKAISLYAEKEDKIIGFEDSIRGYKALNQTPALSILICSKEHPQIQTLPEEVIHFESLEDIENNFNK